jgi:hypothetical protein
MSFHLTPLHINLHSMAYLLKAAICLILCNSFICITVPFSTDSQITMLIVIQQQRKSKIVIKKNIFPSVLILSLAYLFFLLLHAFLMFAKWELELKDRRGREEHKILWNAKEMRNKNSKNGYGLVDCELTNVNKQFCTKPNLILPARAATRRLIVFWCSFFCFIFFSYPHTELFFLDKEKSRAINVNYKPESHHINMKMNKWQNEQPK